MAITLDVTSVGTTVGPSSSVSGGTNVNLVPRLTTTETTFVNNCDNIVVKCSGVNGLTPTFICPTPANFVFGEPWNGAAETGFFSYDNLTWTAIGNAPVYAGGNVSCTHTSAFNQNDVWFARNRREGTSQIGAWITTLAAAYPTLIRNLAGGSSYIVDTYSAQTDELGRAVAATSLYGFGIGTNRPGKLRVILLSGVHAGEDYSTTCYKKGVEWLCSGAPEAVALRRAFEFVCLPLVNAPGRDGGHSRAQFQVNGTQNDLNRHFEDAVSPFETVGKPRTVLNAEVSNNNLAAMIDMHSFSGEGRNSLEGYTDTSPLNGAYATAVALRTSFGSAGATNANTTETWAINLKAAQLSFTAEFNRAWGQTDANATTLGQAVMLALYDILGSFTGVTQAVRGTPFARRAG